MTELLHTHTKKKRLTKWKQEQATKKEHRSIDQVFRESARKAKAQLQLKLVMDINSNKMFYHYISIKPPKKENIGDLLNGDCDSGTVGLGKAEVLHNFVTLSFAAMIARPQQSRDYLQERELSPVNKDQVRDLLRDL